MSLYEYRIKEVENGCIGIYVECNIGGFSILEDDGNLSIINDVYEGFKEEVFLYKLEDHH
ncbi:hypothetical protein ROD_29492 [Citrobacter rodentium ICC168]|uniref:Uncharacterized protein n=1 Tax=Citrobacter rodentium (strain ICC168) TaxID=637910 RepID=D2TJP7_CITRI|nr:hypothetical protein ROD_29492 [Citrobacter rodentium ICC168]